MSNKTNVHAFVEDPAHGWLGVTLEELEAAGCVNMISAYSYMDLPRRKVWLEEDCDLSTFLAALARAERNPAYEYGTLRHGFPYLMDGPERAEARQRAWDGLNVTNRYVERTHIRNLPGYDRIAVMRVLRNSGGAA